MKKKILILTLLLFATGLFWHCSEEIHDNAVTFGVKHKKPQIKYLKGAEAKLVMNQLEKKVSKSKLRILGKAGTYARSNEGTIDYSEIMQVIDTLGNNYYTFRILNHPDDQEGKFHNLVYSFDNDELKLLMLKYENFSSNYLLQANSTLSSYSLIADTPCDDNPIPISGGGGGGETPFDPGIPTPDYGAGTAPGGSSGGGSSGGGSSGGGSSGGGGSSQQPSPGEVTEKYCATYCYDNRPSGVESSTHMILSGLNVNGDGCVCFYVTRQISYQRIGSSTYINTNLKLSDSSLYPCDPTGDFGVLLPLEKEDCDVLKDLLKPEKQNLKPIINSLKAKASSSKNEWSSSQKMENVYNPTSNSMDLTYFNTPVIEGTPYSSPVTIGSDYIGSTHSHPKDTYPIFSWGDLQTLRDTYNECRIFLRQNVSIQIVCYNKNNPAQPLVYALRINDFTKLNDKINADWSNSKLNGKSKEEKLDFIHKDLARSYKANENNLEAFFLHNFKDYGIDLYKANNDQTNWSKLSLNTTTNNPNGELQTTPCP
jgi:hypothetical protein